MKEISQLIEPRRVHRSVYTDPEIFQKEMERVFRDNWVFLLHESQIPKKDDYKLIRIGG